MYRRLSAILFPVFTLLLAGAVLWGYQVNQEKNSILLKAENQYQRAFHDLSYHVDQLQNELGTTLAINSTSTASQRRGLVNVWRLTSEARNEINQLPLTLLPFNKTEEFLSNIASFSYRVAVRDLTKEPMSPEEMQSLTALYDRSKEITNELRDVQSKVIANNLRWMDVEVALATEQKALDNTIIDGFQTVDKKVSEYEDLNWGPSMTGLFEKRTYQALAGTDVTPDEIKQKTAQLLGLPDGSAVQVVENGAGTEYSSFSASVKDPNTQEDISADFTKKGGQLIWFMKPKTVNERNVDTEKAREAAQQFLEAHGYSGMKAISYDEYQNVASITFAAQKDNVLLYPEKVTAMIALDNGEITGLQASDYLFEHRDRTIPTPALSLEQVKAKLNPTLQVSDQTLALIKNEIEKEVLCYQFIGTINGGNYRIFLNADTGNEEKVEILRPVDADVSV
ncbi:germination protein YpeB [Paenibacillus koleovorans]|uniref:germination protein YpeB n=1 Tax=Paenibacillus koleovorans TaxID=121608 RepID=UPI000FD7D934|nr:germination protein YpeB [Paenibacillus koleovorans]